MVSVVESICGGFDRTIKAPIQQRAQLTLQSSMFGSYETAKPVELEEGPRRTNKCRYCPPHLKCMLDEDTDGVWIAQCGIVHTHFASEDMSARTFAGDTTVDKDKKTHTSVVTDDERRQLVHILPAQVPKDVTKHVLWKANNRLNQCTVWLKFIRSEEVGKFWLTESEVNNARRALHAACTQWAKEGGNEAGFGSPIFWTIGMIMEMVAQRVRGYTMPTQELCDIVSLDGLFAHFTPYQSQTSVTEESEFGATNAKGKGTVGQAAVNKVVRRNARLDPLGGGRQGKMATLSQLLMRSHVWLNPDPEAPEEERWLGLSAPVRALQQPVLMERAPNEKGGEPIFLPVRRVYYNRDAAMTGEKAALRRKAGAAAKAEAAAAAAAPPLESPGLTFEEMEADNDEDRVLAAAREADMDAYDAAHQPKPKSAPRSVTSYELGKLNWAQVLRTQNYARKGEQLRPAWEQLNADHRARISKAKDAQDRKDRKAQEAAVNKRAQALLKTRKADAKEDAKAAKREDAKQNKDFADLMAMGAKQERAERAIAKGKAACYIDVTRKQADEATNTIPVIVIRDVKAVRNSALEKGHSRLSNHGGKGKGKGMSKGKGMGYAYTTGDHSIMSVSVGRGKCKAPKAKGETDEPPKKLTRLG